MLKGNNRCDSLIHWMVPKSWEETCEKITYVLMLYANGVPQFPVGVVGRSGYRMVSNSSVCSYQDPTSSGRHFSKTMLKETQYIQTFTSMYTWLRELRPPHSLGIVSPTKT